MSSFWEPDSGIAAGYCFSVDDGQIRFITPFGPLGGLEARADTGFLVGVRGYGVGEAAWYDQRGQVRQTWPTNGHYVVEKSGTRVIECLSESHLVRILDDGTVLKGALSVSPFVCNGDEIRLAIRLLCVCHRFLAPRVPAILRSHPIASISA